MRSAARIGTHPIHPMLIPFPFACWVLSVAADLYAAYTNGRHTFAYYLAAVGCVMALVAAIPGFVDLFGAIPAGNPARRTAWKHAILNVLALGLFALSVAARPDPASTNYLAYGASLAGLITIAFSAWLGGTLVYDHKVGVPGVAEPGRESSMRNE